MMSTAFRQLSVACEPAAEKQVRAIVLTLSQSFRVTDRAPDVLVIAGSTGWAQRAIEAVSREGMDIIVLDPVDTEPRLVRALADVAAKQGAAISLSEGYAGDPGFETLAAAPFPMSEAAAVFITSTTLANLEMAVFEQRRLLRACGITQLVVEDAQITGAAALITATAKYAPSDVLVRMLATRTHSGGLSHRIHGLGAHAAIKAELRYPDCASPMRLWISSATGITQMPLIYESSHRATFRSHHGAFGHQGGSSSLLAFAEDLEFVHALR